MLSRPLVNGVFSRDRAGVAGRYIREILPLGFLSPRIVEAIVYERLAA
jgi:hypothetical protein